MTFQFSTVVPKSKGNRTLLWWPTQVLKNRQNHAKPYKSSYSTNVLIKTNNCLEGGTLGNTSVAREMAVFASSCQLGQDTLFMDTVKSEQY